MLQMTKSSIFTRFLQLPVLNCIAYVLALIAVIHFFGYFGKYNYRYVPEEEIENVLFKAVASDIVIKNSKPDCKYQETLKHQKSLLPLNILKKVDDFSAAGVVNGSYIPNNCNPQFSVAILVTYRNRQSQLDVFLPYMHNFLRKQSIHYKIYLIEQQDEKPWNKGMLYNIGAKQAIADKFPCLILHDVDLLPLDESNLYACAAEPRHMSASIDKFRYVLTYDTLVGGVLAIQAQHYTALNGFSNMFEGWGGEDDEFAARIAKHDLSILRFPRRMSKYTMLPHQQERKNEERFRVMAESERRAAGDGLSSVRYRSRVLKANRLFTWLGVQL